MSTLWKQERTIDDLVESFRAAKRRGVRTTVLVGAGCSVTAGIPAAQGILDIIAKEYPRAYERAASPTYADCMAELSIAERRHLVGRLVDNSTINWAHLLLACLMQHGHVDRVLTTNFDSLFLRACSTLGFLPPSYDLASSGHFEPAFVASRAVLHLHGQGNGFVLLNTSTEFENFLARMKPVFRDAAQSWWLVIGYSGENDPTLSHLAAQLEFSNELYWVCHSNALPPEEATRQLLEKVGGTFFVRGYDSDGFLNTLHIKLDCPYPSLLYRPFSHLDSVLSQISPYGEGPELDLVAQSRSVVQCAMERYEREVPPGTATAEESGLPPSVSLESIQLFQNGDYSALSALLEPYSDTDSDFVRAMLVGSYAIPADRLLRQAPLLDDSVQKAKLLTRAVENATRLVEIAPGEKSTHLLVTCIEALGNVAPLEAARHISGAIPVLKKSTPLDEEHVSGWNGIARMLQLRFHYLYENWPDQELLWGIVSFLIPRVDDGVMLEGKFAFTLRDLILQLDAEKAKQSFGLLLQRVKGVVSQEVERANLLYVEGSLLLAEARKYRAERPKGLLQKAVQRLEQAAELKPDNTLDVLYETAVAYEELADCCDGPDAASLVSQAVQHYELILESKPEDIEARRSRANALIRRYQLSPLSEQDSLQDASLVFEKLAEQAPERLDIQLNWGVALMLLSQSEEDLGRRKTAIRKSIRVLRRLREAGHSSVAVTANLAAAIELAVQLETGKRQTKLRARLRELETELEGQGGIGTEGAMWRSLDCGSLEG